MTELPRCASSLPRQRKHKRGGKKVCTRALRQHTAIENLLTDAAQQPLEFYDSQPLVQAAAITPVVSPDVLLGESACCAASTAPSPAACSNELLEILNGLDSPTVEVDDAVSLHLNSEYGTLNVDAVSLHLDSEYGTLNAVLYCCPHCTYIFSTARAW